MMNLSKDNTMKIIIKMLFITLLVQSCNGQKETSNMKTDTLNYKNSDYILSYKIILDSIKNCFEAPNDSAFKNRVLEVYGTDIDKSNYTDVELTMKDYGELALKNYNYIIPYIMDVPNNEDATKKICNYNKMIFNNDGAATNWIKSKHSDLIIEIVKEYGYTENKNWLQFAFSRAKLSDPDELQSFLFDYKCKDTVRGESGDCNTISKLRKDMLAKMIQNGAELSQLHLVANMVSNSDQEMYEEDTAELYNYLIAQCYAAGQSGIIEYIYDTKPKIKEVFKKNNYYNVEGLEDYTNNFYKPQEERFGLGSLGPDPYLGYGVINDPDGYSNLRKGKGTNHPIVKKIIEDEKFAIKRKDGEWWLVVLADGTEGWLHESRVRLLESY